MSDLPSMTPEFVGQIAKQNENGASLFQIAKEHGIKYTTLRYAVDQYRAGKYKKVKRLCWTEEMDQQLTDLIAARHTFGSAAVKMKLTEKQVRDHCAKMGIEPLVRASTGRRRSREWDVSEERQLIQMLDDNYTQPEIAFQLNRTLASVKAKLEHVRGLKKYLTKPQPDKPKPVQNNGIYVRRAIDIQRGYRIPPDKERYLGELLKTGIPCEQAYRAVGGVRI